MPRDRADAEDRHQRLPGGRRVALASFVSDVGQVTVAELAERFNVSADTIRRDLDRLDSDGVLIRTHGGAVALLEQSRADTGLDVRLRLQTSAKEKIGAVAATLVQDGSVLMINGGTTALAVMRHLRQHRELTVATNNLRIPLEADPKIFRDLYIFGGRVRQLTETSNGPVRFQTAAGGKEHDVRSDIAFIAVGGVSAESGFTTSALDDAAMMSEMMSKSAKVAILADSSKYGRRLFAQIADLGAVDYFISDQEPPSDVRAAFDASGVGVLVAQ